MCRNIRTLANFDPPATDDEIRASALQFVRKLSGSTKPSRANEAAFNQAVEDVTAAAERLVRSFTTSAPPRNREEEARKARERARERYASQDLRGAGVPRVGRDPPRSAAHPRVALGCSSPPRRYLTPPATRRRRRGADVRRRVHQAQPAADGPDVRRDDPDPAAGRRSDHHAHARRPDPRPRLSGRCPRRTWSDCRPGRRASSTTSAPRRRCRTRRSSDRAAMLRAMLADRFRLLAHPERREVPSFDLRAGARATASSGPGLVASDDDCDGAGRGAPRGGGGGVAERCPAAAAPAIRSRRSTPCRFVGMPNGVRGEMTIGDLASMLRGPPAASWWTRPGCAAAIA